jgi:hypothetical protein
MQQNGGRVVACYHQHRGATNPNTWCGGNSNNSDDDCTACNGNCSARNRHAPRDSNY